jgi:hypothetical protein
MSNEKDKELKTLTREILVKQIEESRRVIIQVQQNIVSLSQQLQQQQGVLNYAEHLLAQFSFPGTEPAKSPLEVK